MKLTEEDVRQFAEDQQSAKYQGLCGGMLRPLVGCDLTLESVKRHGKTRFKNPNSYNTFLAVLRSFCRWKRSKIPPVGKGLMQRFELEQIEGMRRERVVRRLEKKGLEIGELREVLKKCRDSLRFAIVWLLHYFGVRPIELVSLGPRQVNFKEMVIKFAGAKTKVEREIFFDEFTGRQLKIFLEARPSYSLVYKVCHEVGIIPKSGRQTFRSLMPAQVNWTPPVRVHELIDLACGHTVQGMDAVYSSVRPHLNKLVGVHYMRELEGGYA